MTLPQEIIVDAERIRQQYRESWLKLGMSPDSSIEALQAIWIRRDKHPYRYLKAVERFYLSLKPIERRILLAECLERGRWYPFWYYGAMDPRVYRNAVIGTMKKARRCL